MDRVSWTSRCFGHTLPPCQCWSLPVHTFVPTLCSQPVLRSQHVCLVHWTHRCLCSPVARQQNFTRVFLHHDLEVIVSCDTQKCNHSWLELAVTTRRRELTCSNMGEDSLWAHTSMGCCAARTKLHPESSFCRSLRNSPWAPSIQWVAGCCQSCSGSHNSPGDWQECWAGSKLQHGRIAVLSLPPP